MNTPSVMIYTPKRDDIRMYNSPVARYTFNDIPSLREPPKLAHSLRGTPTATWITKKELLVDKSSFFVGGDDGI